MAPRALTHDNTDIFRQGRKIMIIIMKLADLSLVRQLKALYASASNLD